MGNFIGKSLKKNSGPTERSQMEEVLLRFGHIADQIFEELDSETLSNCPLVGRSWNLFFDHGKVRPFLIIKKYTNIDEEYLRKLISKINVGTATDLATTVRNVYPRRGRNVNVITSYYANTPFHQAARNGHLLLCQLIIDNVNDKNPKDFSRITPLHHAATNGHLEICQLIIDNVGNKNPKDHLGNTPLHNAAKKGHFEICQLIIDNVDDKNPKDYYRKYTPLHYAAENVHFEI